ncbi:activator of basal transcription 1 [Lampetra fluviatilis]
MAEAEEAESRESGPVDDDDVGVDDVGVDDVGVDGDDVGVDDDGAGQPSARPVVPGVVYLSRIPPRLRVKHVRQLLSRHGELGRIFLQPEDKHTRKVRKKISRSNARSYTEGWVEFVDKKKAKLAAIMLNNNRITTRKRSRFYDDLWSLKYLHRFRWAHLSERLAYERTVRNQRLRTEIAQAKKETGFYVANVERSATLGRLAERRKKQAATAAARDGGATAGQAAGEVEEEPMWGFRQRRTEGEIQEQKKKRAAVAATASSKKVQRSKQKASRIAQESKSNRELLAKIFQGSVDGQS